MPRKPKPLPLPRLADPSKRFDTILTALLAVKKEELQKVDAKVKEVRKALDQNKTKRRTGSSN